jgi:hypothetical protein
MDRIFFPLLNDNPSHAISAALAELVCNDLRADEQTLSTLHADGPAAVSAALIAGSEYIASVPRAEAEIAEAIGAQSASEALNLRAYNALSYTFDQVRSIAPNLPPEQAKVLRAAYAIGSRRLSLRRVSDLRLLLEQTHNARPTHGPTLLAWGVPPRRLDEPAELLALLPDAGAALQKERGEAEAANAARDAAEQRFYALVNPLLRRVLATQEDHPEVARRFASTINKYAAELNPPVSDDAPTADEPA